MDSRTGPYFMNAEIPPEVSLEELRMTGAWEFRSLPTGRMVTAGNGRRVHELRGVEFAPTRFGRVEKDSWYRLCEEAISQEGKLRLLEAVVKHVRSCCAWLKNDLAVRQYAIECVSSGTYRSWDGFSSLLREDAE